MSTTIQPASPRSNTSKSSTPTLSNIVILENSLLDSNDVAAATGLTQLSNQNAAKYSRGGDTAFQYHSSLNFSGSEKCSPINNLNIIPTENNSKIHVISNVTLVSKQHQLQQSPTITYVDATKNITNTISSSNKVGTNKLISIPLKTAKANNQIQQQSAAMAASGISVSPTTTITTPVMQKINVPRNIQVVARIQTPTLANNNIIMCRTSAIGGSQQQSLNPQFHSQTSDTSLAINKQFEAKSKNNNNQNKGASQNFKGNNKSIGLYSSSVKLVQNMQQVQNPRNKSPTLKGININLNSLKTLKTRPKSSTHFITPVSSSTLPTGATIVSTTSASVGNNSSSATVQSYQQQMHFQSNNKVKSNSIKSSKNQLIQINQQQSSNFMNNVMTQSNVQKVVSKNAKFIGQNAVNSPHYIIPNMNQQVNMIAAAGSSAAEDEAAAMGNSSLILTSPNVQQIRFVDDYNTPSHGKSNIKYINESSVIHASGSSILPMKLKTIANMGNRSSNTKAQHHLIHQQNTDITQGQQFLSFPATPSQNHNTNLSSPLPSSDSNDHIFINGQQITEEASARILQSLSQKVMENKYQNLSKSPLSNFHTSSKMNQIQMSGNVSQQSEKQRSCEDGNDVRRASSIEEVTFIENIPLTSKTERSSHFGYMVKENENIQEDDTIGVEIRPAPMDTSNGKFHILQAVLQDHTYFAALPEIMPEKTQLSNIVQLTQVNLNKIVSSGLDYSYKSVSQDDDANSVISTGSRNCNTMDIDLGEETETAPEGEGEDDSITRCICDLTHDDGYMICCDKCSAWQHVDCMGIDRMNIPDEYNCEICQPRIVDKNRARQLQLLKRKEQTILLSNNNNQNNVFETANSTMNPGTSIVKSSNQFSAKGTGSSLPSGRKTKLTQTSRKKPDSSSSQNVAAKRTKRSETVTNRINGKRKELKKITKKKVKNSDLSSEKITSLVRTWIDSYERAITNHYSPELRARLQAIGKMQSQNPIAYNNEKLISSASVHNLIQKCTIVPHAGGKILISTTDIDPKTPIIEIRGKYMLSNQHKQLQTIFGTPGSIKNSNKNAGPFLFLYQLSVGGLEICVDTRTYGNDARFVRKSCRPNAEILHNVEKGVIHLYIVSTNNIKASTEITIQHDDTLAQKTGSTPLLPQSTTTNVCACGLVKDCLYMSQLGDGTAILPTPTTVTNTPKVTTSKASNGLYYEKKNKKRFSRSSALESRLRSISSSGESATEVFLSPQQNQSSIQETRLNNISVDSADMSPSLKSPTPEPDVEPLSSVQPLISLNNSLHSTKQYICDDLESIQQQQQIHQQEIIEDVLKVSCAEPLSSPINKPIEVNVLSPATPIDEINTENVSNTSNVVESSEGIDETNEVDDSQLNSPTKVISMRKSIDEYESPSKSPTTEMCQTSAWVMNDNDAPEVEMSPTKLSPSSSTMNALQTPTGLVRKKNIDSTTTSSSSSSVVEKEKPKNSNRKLTREERKMEAIVKAFEKMEQSQQRKQELKEQRVHGKRRSISSSASVQSLDEASHSKKKISNTTPVITHKRKKRKSKTITQFITNHSLQQKKKNLKRNRINLKEKMPKSSSSEVSLELLKQLPSDSNSKIDETGLLSKSSNVTSTTVESFKCPQPNENKEAELLLTFSQSSETNKPDYHDEIVKQISSLSNIPQITNSMLHSSPTSDSSPIISSLPLLSSACMLIEAAVGPLEQSTTNNGILAESTLLCQNFKFPQRAKTKKSIMNDWLNKSEILAANVNKVNNNINFQRLMPDQDSGYISEEKTAIDFLKIKSGFEDLKKPDNLMHDSKDKICLVAQKVEEFIMQNSPQQEDTHYSTKWEEKCIPNLLPTFTPTIEPSILSNYNCSSNNASESAVKKRWLRQAISEETADDLAMACSSPPPNNGFTTPLKKRRVICEAPVSNIVEENHEDHTLLTAMSTKEPMMHPEIPDEKKLIASNPFFNHSENKFALDLSVLPIKTEHCKEEVESEPEVKECKMLDIKEEVCENYSTNDGNNFKNVFEVFPKITRSKGSQKYIESTCERISTEQTLPSSYSVNLCPQIPDKSVEEIEKRDTNEGCIAAEDIKLDENTEEEMEEKKPFEDFRDVKRNHFINTEVPIELQNTPDNNSATEDCVKKEEFSDDSFKCKVEANVQQESADLIKSEQIILPDAPSNNCYGVDNLSDDDLDINEMEDLQKAIATFHSENIMTLISRNKLSKKNLTLSRRNSEENLRITCKKPVKLNFDLSVQDDQTVNVTLMRSNVIKTNDNENLKKEELTSLGNDKDVHYSCSSSLATAEKQGIESNVSPTQIAAHETNLGHLPSSYQSNAARNLLSSLSLNFSFAKHPPCLANEKSHSNIFMKKFECNNSRISSDLLNHGSSTTFLDYTISKNAPSSMSGYSDTTNTNALEIAYKNQSILAQTSQPTVPSLSTLSSPHVTSFPIVTANVTLSEPLSTLGATSSTYSKIFTKTASSDPRLNPNLNITEPTPPATPKRKLSINEYRKRKQQSYETVSSNTEMNKSSDPMIDDTTSMSNSVTDKCYADGKHKNSGGNQMLEKNNNTFEGVSSSNEEIASFNATPTLAELQSENISERLKSLKYFNEI